MDNLKAEVVTIRIPISTSVNLLNQMISQAVITVILLNNQVVGIMEEIVRDNQVENLMDRKLEVVLIIPVAARMLATL